MKKLELLYQFSSQITTTTDTTRLYRTIVQFMRSMFDLDFATLMLLDDDKKQLTICDTVGFPESMIGTFSLVQGQGLSTHVVRTRFPAVVVDFQTEARFEVPPVVTRNNIRSALCVPMMIEDEVFGVLIGHTLQKRIFTPEDTTLFQNMGNLAAIAIKNALGMHLLRKARDEWEMTFNAVPDLIMIIDRRCRAMRINRAMAEALAVQGAEAEGLHCYELMGRMGEIYRQPACADAASWSGHTTGDTTAAGGPDTAVCPVAQLFRTGQGAMLERTLRKSGAARTFEITVSPLRDDHGMIIAAIKVMRDITDRNTAEADLQESEARLRVIFDTSQAGILQIDPDGAICFANRRLAEMFGMTMGELIGTSYLSHIHASERALSEDLMRRLIRNEVSAVSTERHYLSRNNTEFWGYLSCKRLEEQDGTLVGLVGIITDITERKHAEADRLELERRLLHAQKLESLGVLAGGIAHDFNNLLMAILGNLDMSLMKLSPLSAARPGIEAAVNASKRAAELTSQMLAYSGKGLFVVKDVNINDLVAENAHLLKTAISKTVKLSLLLGQNIPPVKADASQLQQVIMNPIINASEAIDDRPGVITLSTGVKESDDLFLKSSRLEDKPRPGRFALLEVTDTGCGMDRATIQRLFDPFFSTKFTGRGLGMSAVLGIIKAHNGAIMVESEVGKGTTMQVLLPLEEASQAELPLMPEEIRTEQDPHPAPLSGTVLVVDDEEVVRDVCAAMIEEFGCRVLTAVDGEDALRLLRDSTEKINLVLMDLTMPRMDGSAAAREMIRLAPDMKVVLSSGYSEHDLSLRFAGQGFAGFIQKPFNLNDLRNVVTKGLWSH